MREDQGPGYNVIFDPISTSALIQNGDRVTLLSGPFMTYRDAVTAAQRCMLSQRT